LYYKKDREDPREKKKGVPLAKTEKNMGSGNSYWL